MSNGDLKDNMTANEIDIIVRGMNEK